MSAASGLLAHHATLVALTAIMAWLMLALTHRTHSPWPALLVFALPLGGLLLNSDVVYGLWHAHLHASVVNSIAHSGLPPENPLLAGEPLRYPYGQHTLAAVVSDSLGIPAAWFFWALTLLCLPPVMLLLDRIARFYGSDPLFRLLAVLCALTLLFAVGSGPVQNMLREVWVNQLGFRNEFRALPYAKFTTQNGSPVGFLMFLMTFVGVGQLLSRRGSALGAMLGPGLLATTGVIGAGLLYPFAWIMAGLSVAFGLMISVWTGWRAPAANTHHLPLVLLAIGLLGLTPLPYLLAASAGKSGDAALSVVPWLSYPLRQAANLALVLALPTVLILANLRQVRARLAGNPAVTALITSTASGGLLAYLLLAAPDRVEYKLASLAFLTLGVVIAAAVTPWARRHGLVAGLLIALCIHPVLNRVSAQSQHRFLDQAIAENGRLMLRDPRRAELQRWARDQTPSDAVFVDRYRTLPAIAGRPLYVGFNPSEERPDEFRTGARPQDGWGMSTDMFLSRISGAPARLIESRRAAARTLWQSPDPDARLKAMAVIQADMAPRPVYVVARDPETRRRLDATTALNVVFDNPAASVYRLTPKHP